MREAEDAAGHEHKGKGPGGGQFVPRGGVPHPHEGKSFHRKGTALPSIYAGGKQEIRQLDPARLQSRDQGFYGKGFYATTSPDLARTYGPKVTQFDVHPEANVLHADLDPSKNDPEFIAEVKKHLIDKGLERARARGKEQALRDEVAGITDNPISWKNAVDEFGTDHGYDVIRHSNGEIVFKNLSALTPRGAHKKPVREAGEHDVSGEPRDEGGKWTKGGGGGGGGGGSRAHVGGVPSYTRSEARSLPGSAALLKDMRAAHARVLSRSRSGVVTLPALYDALKEAHPDLTLEDFHRQVMAWQQADKLDLATVNDPRLHSPDELKKMLRTGATSALGADPVRGYVLAVRESEHDVSGEARLD